MSDDNASEPRRGRRTARRPPRRPNAERLEKAALHYLERFASSEHGLRRVLERRIIRARRHYDDLDESGLRRAIDGVVEKMIRLGFVDDPRFAEMMTRSLARRGGSRRRIAATLRRKGVGADDIDAALAGLADESGDAEVKAACALVRRRRLGPFRQKDRTERRDRDLASLARAGFSLDLAKRVLDLAGPDELDALENDPGVET